MEWLIPVIIVVALVVIIGIYLWATYNSLVTLNVRVDEAWSDITVQLKRRADLIPNLIEAVKGYAAHEKAVFENVTQARAETLQAQGPAEAGAAENHMQQALKSIFAVAEAYPQLQASQNFLQLQAELVDTEDKIQAVAPVLQRRRARAQHEDQGVPEHAVRARPRLPRARVLRGHRAGGHRRAAARAVLRSRRCTARSPRTSATPSSSSCSSSPIIGGLGLARRVDLQRPRRSSSSRS